MVAEISHEADPDGNFVEGFTGQMPALDLPEPALPHFDLTVPGIGTVPNDKVVGHSVLHPPLFVIRIKDTGIAAAGAAVMDHNVFPVAQFRFGRVDQGFYRRDKNQLGSRGFDGGRRLLFFLGGFFQSRRGHAGAQEFAGVKGVAPQPVPVSEVFNGNPAVPGDFG